jgi:hypothetical protein
MRVWLQRQVSAIVVTSGQATLEAKEATETIERGDHRGKRSRPHGFIAAGEFREVVRKPLGGSGAAPGLSASGLLQTIDRGLECRDIVGVCRRFLVGVRPQHRIEHGSELANGGKLGLLVIGNETLDGLQFRHSQGDVSRSPSCARYTTVNIR